MLDNLPVFGVCGLSGSGKTTLIEQIIRPLRDKGLRLAVVKHAAGGIDADRPGADSDRFFQAGADVVLEAPAEEFLRTHRAGGGDLTAALARLAETHDLVLVEGHKGTGLRKVWLLGENEAAPLEDVHNVAAALPPGADRAEAVLAIIDEWLGRTWLNAPVFGCALIGGTSRRMGTPKHLLRAGGRTWLERTVKLLRRACRTVVIAGAGGVPGSPAPCPRLADAPDARGPMSGILAAMRWAPHASWLVAACDLPGLSADALDWLLSTRRPGVWAALPRLAGSPGVEPVLAHYDFRSRRLLERSCMRGNFCLNDLAGHPKVASPPVPSHLAAAWQNSNAPEDLSSPARSHGQGDEDA